MSLALNVPQSGQKSGPVSAYWLIPLSDITTQQGAHNLYRVDCQGLMSMYVDATECQADLLMQFFSQDSPIGQPMPLIHRAGQQKLYKFDSPLDFVILSNMSGANLLPLGIGQIIGNFRFGATTQGYVFIADTSAGLDIEAVSPPQLQVPLAQVVLPASSPATISVNVDATITALEIYLDQGSFVTSLIVTGHQSAYEYYTTVGSPGFFTPQLVSIPIMSVFDTQIDISIAYSVGPWPVAVVGRRDTVSVDVRSLGDTVSVVNPVGGHLSVAELPTVSALTIDNAKTTTGRGTVWGVSGYDSAIYMEVNNTNTGGTTTVDVQGSFDGANWYDCGYYQTVVNGVAQATLTRAVGAVTLGTGKRNVFQLLDAFPQYSVNYTPMGTGGSVTTKGYGIQ